MDSSLADRRSHLFIVRIWAEALDGGRVEWRGQVRHALSGEPRYFRDWPTLVEYLLTLLPSPCDEAPCGG